MDLETLLKEGRIEQRTTVKQEITDLLRLATESLGDAMVEQVSLDGRFNRAYDAALVLSTIPIRCAGYRTKGEGHHFMVFELLSVFMGKSAEPTARYLQKCRKIRNMSTYSRSGIVSRVEVEELISRVEELGTDVRRWLHANYPEYC